MTLIAQLTDLHVLAGGALAYGRVDTLEHLRRAVDHLNALPLDGIAITGDLVENGRSERLRDAASRARPPLCALMADPGQP